MLGIFAAARRATYLVAELRLKLECRTDAVHVGKDLHANCSRIAIISRHSEYIS
jgi:hypothetical protein